MNLSVITKIELLSIEPSEASQATERLIANSVVLPLSDEVVVRTIEVRKKWKLKLPDAVIAATALIFDATLVTHNAKDFRRVEGLKIVDPFER